MKLKKHKTKALISVNRVTFQLSEVRYLTPLVCLFLGVLISSNKPEFLKYATYGPSQVTMNSHWKLNFEEENYLIDVEYKSV